MDLEIRDILSPDAPQAVNDIENWRPPDEQTFGVLVEVFIGPRGEDSQEMFTLIVCTPSWLEKELAKATAQGGKPYILGYHHVVVRSWSFPIVRQLLEELCAYSEGPDWEFATRRLSRYLRSEYQDTGLDK